MSDDDRKVRLINVSDVADDACRALINIGMIEMLSEDSIEWGLRNDIRDCLHGRYSVKHKNSEDKERALIKITKAIRSVCLSSDELKALYPSIF